MSKAIPLDIERCSSDEKTHLLRDRTNHLDVITEDCAYAGDDKQCFKNQQQCNNNKPGSVPNQTTDDDGKPKRSRAAERWHTIAEKVRDGELLLVGAGDHEHHEHVELTPTADKEEWLKGQKTFQDTFRSVYTLTHKHAAWAFLTYCGLCVIVFCFLLEDWSIIDALYFSMVTCSTVGYGDLVPSTVLGQAFTIVFALSGVCLLGMLLGELGNEIAEAQEAAVERAHLSVQNKILWLFDSTPPEVTTFLERAIEAEHRQEQEGRRERSILRVIFEFVTVLILLSFIALAICESPGAVGDGTGASLSLFHAFYFSTLTATTVGYGDYAPQSEGSRLLAIFFIPLAVGAMGKFLSDVASLVIETRAANVREEFSSHALSLETINYMDEDGDGKVSRHEFLEFMLVAMNKIDRDLVVELREHFDRLDVDGTGYLSKGDLIHSARIRLKRITNKLELSAYKQDLLRKASLARAKRRRERDNRKTVALTDLFSATRSLARSMRNWSFRPRAFSAQ